MSNDLVRRGGTRSLDDEWGRMNQALAKIGLASVPARQQRSPAPVMREARLIVGLDLTGSREASLKHARVATAAMFDAIKSFGSVVVQLAYYRGITECKASRWHRDPAILSDAMRKLACEAGNTQIARLMQMALKEKEKLSGLVFVGDHCEDDQDQLIAPAKEFGRRNMPLWIFHECSDENDRALFAKPIFKNMAAVSGGIYVEFKPDSGAVLREVLASIAAFSTAGAEGLKQVEAVRTPEARQLQARLMLGPGKEK